MPWILGGICGNLASVFTDSDSVRPLLLCAFGISAGIFVGSIAGGACGDFEYVSDHIPAHGLKGRTLLVMLAMAAGKVAGSLYYFPWKF